MHHYDIVIVGAGAAGCFAGSIASELFPSLKIRILEKTRQPLAKVRISGGGRCNVTHHCFDAQKLVSYYPRGENFLRNGFSRFGPQDMIRWLADHGVDVKVEKDGRMFPSTDKSETIIDALLSSLKKADVDLCLEQEVTSISFSDSLFSLTTKKGETIYARQVLLATGGIQKSYELAASLGHEIVPPIPSLFTFELENAWIKELSGSVAPSAEVFLEGFPVKTIGPMLITHWGLSGPAVLKLSAFAARWLFARDYHAQVFVNWTGLPKPVIQEELFAERKRSSSKNLFSTPLFSLSKKLWSALLSQISSSLPQKTWAHVSKQEIRDLLLLLVQTEFSLIGKSLNKEEFVTSGGVSLDQVDPKTFASKIVPGLYFAGELLDIDGVTGGFNFQNAWTGGFLAAKAMVANLVEKDTK